MLPIIIAIVAVCVIAFGLAFYFGWFDMPADNGKQKSRIASWVDTRKAKADKAEKYNTAQRAKRL